MSIKDYLDSLEITQDFIPPNPRTRTGTPIRPTHVTIHNTANEHPGATASAHNKYIRSPAAMQVRKVSWHFTVDDGAIFYHVPVKEKASHAGRGNSLSLGIEICMYRGMDADAAYLRAASLVAYLCLELDIPPQNIVQHHFWTGKDCPIVLRRNPGAWDDFLRLVGQEIDVLRNLPAGIMEDQLDDDSGVRMSYAPAPPAQASEEELNAVLKLIDRDFEEIGEEPEVAEPLVAPQ